MDVVTNISKTKREYNVTFNDEITLRLDKKVIDKLTIMDEVDMPWATTIWKNSWKARTAK